MSIKIESGGNAYELWESATVSRSIDNATGTFSLTTSKKDDFPIKRGDPVVITISGESKIFGFADDMEESGDVDTHTIRISGRDNTCDLIDSTVPDACKVVEERISLKAFCEKVITSLGSNIPVIDMTGDSNIFEEDDLQAAESGDTCMSYLQSYSRKKQVFLVPSGTGDLLIFKPGATEATTALIHRKNDTENNVKSYSAKHSQTARYNEYVCRSQDNIGFDDNADYSAEGTSRTGVVTDDEIRKGRYLEIIAEESMTDDECLKRATEEANVRRARTTEYTALVAGHTQESGVVWDIGMKVPVKDEIANVNGFFIIREVEYSQSVEGGSITKIICAPIDAYTLQAVQNLADERKSTNVSLTRKDPEEPSRNVRR